MATMSFIANVDKTVTVQGNVFSITIPTLPSGFTMYLNEVQVTSGQVVQISEDTAIRIDYTPTPVTLDVSYTNANNVTIDGNTVLSGASLTLAGGNHTAVFTGATAIPSVTLNGDGCTGFSVNGIGFTANDLPYTFQPLGGVINTIFYNGEDIGDHDITISGTNISAITVNNVSETLPFTTTVDENLQIAVSGEIYQVDVSSIGGAKIYKDGEMISDGTSVLHQIIDVESDTFISIDGTHEITVTGEDVKSISVNGVLVDVESLPASISNRNMTATFSVNGYEPSEVHVIGEYIDTVTVDGVSVPVSSSGSVAFELTTVENNHFISIMGSQPREYAITWNDNGSTTIYMDGEEMADGATNYISKDVYIEALPEPIPVHIESAEDARVQVNGRDYNSTDFSVQINSATEIDVTTETCKLTVDYGDNSYSFVVPQGIVYITAPHRDGWIFDTWSSNNVGIDSPKSVQTTINLTGRNNANLVAHYQRIITWNKPNEWN